MKEHKREYVAWLQTLENIQLEIVGLKIRIAEIGKYEISVYALEHLERFQNNFLNKDSAIAELRRDIKQQYLRLADQTEMRTGYLSNMLTEQQNKLRNDVAELEKELSILKGEFDNCFNV